MIFVDSSIWCAYLDMNAPEHEDVKEFIWDSINRNTVVVNTIIVMEVAHYLTRYLPREGLEEKIETFINLKSMWIIDFSRPLMDESLKQLVKYAETEGLGGRDSTIIATMKTCGVETLISHDKALKRVAEREGLEVLDPVENGS
jgi:predicted nucleic acid-binding protein